MLPADVLEPIPPVPIGTALPVALAVGATTTIAGTPFCTIKSYCFKPLLVTEIVYVPDVVAV